MVTGLFSPSVMRVGYVCNDISLLLVLYVLIKSRFIIHVHIYLY